MKSYPSIRHATSPDSRLFYAFDKTDGSCIRAEWNRKQGLYKFGSRTHLIDESYPLLGESISLVREIFPPLERALSDRRHKQAILFFEFFGENSFAGSHKEEPHRVVLIDAAIDKRGLIDPGILVSLGDLVPCPTFLGKCSITEELLWAIYHGSYPSMPGGITFEGVVFKLGQSERRVMFKKKTEQWLLKLREKCGKDNKLFEALQ